MKRKLMSVVVMLVIVATTAGCASSGFDSASGKVQDSEVKYTSKAQVDTKGSEFTECAATDDLRLLFQPSTTQFCVENLRDASRWYSSPQNLSDEQTASKLQQLKMQASLVIDYTNVDAKKTGNINTYTGSVRSGDYTAELIESGVRFTYHLSEIDATIPFSVRLENDSLITEVDASAIKTKAEVRITGIAVTPYFMSGSDKDSGYLFLADGSGAVVRFDSHSSSPVTYSRPVYGEEPTNLTSDYYLRSGEQNVCMPVWGTVANGSAVLAIGEGGIECASLNAAAAGQLSSRANAYASYLLLDSVMHKVGNYETEIYDNTGNTLDKITTRYKFLSGSDADYSGMARAYRSYLEEKYTVSDGKYNSGIYLDIYGAVTKTVSGMGIPHDTIIPLTTADEVIEISDYLRENAIDNITVRYRMWDKNEIRHKRLSGIAAASAATSIAPLKKLTESDRIRFYPAVMSLQTFEGGGFIDHIRNASYSITGLPFAWHNFSQSTLNETGTAYYRNSLDRIDRLADRVLKGFKARKLENMALGDIGSQLYCDFKGDGYRRTQAMEIMSGILKRAAGSTGSLMLDEANAYALPYADIIYSTPVCHSNQDILDESVPFYTIALSGLAECVAPSLNHSNTGDDALLYAVAAGSGICYSWIYENNSALLDTELSSLSDISFQNTRDDVTALCKRLAPLLDQTSGSRIYSHELISSTVSVTTYENGVRVYVNFGSQAVTLENGSIINGKDFAVETEGR